MAEKLPQSHLQQKYEGSGVCPPKEHACYPFLRVKDKYHRIFVKDLADKKAIVTAMNAFYTHDSIFSHEIEESISIIQSGGDTVLPKIQKTYDQNPEMGKKIREWVSAFSSLFVYHTMPNSERKEGLKMELKYADLFGIMPIYLPQKTQDIVTDTIIRTGIESLYYSNEQSNALFREDSLFITSLDRFLPTLSITDFQFLQQALAKTVKFTTFHQLRKEIDSVIKPIEKNLYHPAHSLLNLAQNLLNIDKRTQYPLRDHLSMGAISGSNIYYDALLLITMLSTLQDTPISEEQTRYILSVYHNSTALFGSLAFGPLEKTTFIESVVSENRMDVYNSRFLPECFTIKKNPTDKFDDHLMIKNETLEQLKNPKVLENFIQSQIKFQRQIFQEHTHVDMESEKLKEAVRKLAERLKTDYSMHPPYELGPEESYMCAAMHSKTLKQTQEFIGKTWEYYYVPLINAFAKKVR